MKLVVFGLSITSSWGNGHATVYRGLLRDLSRRGLEITFFERDAPWYACNRDLRDCDYVRVVLYRDPEQLKDLLPTELAGADVALMGSYYPDGVEVAEHLACRRDLVRLYYDIDTPLSLAAFAETGGTTYLRADQIPIFDAVLSFTGGRALRELEERWGARRAVAFYCAASPETHRRVVPHEEFASRLSYMGTYSADRNAAWESLFLRPALRLRERRFVLVGSQYPEMELPSNVVHVEHLPPAEHSIFYSSSELTLNITRGPMVSYGYSPSVRLFEAACCGTCVVSDRWEGLGEVFEIGSEILVAADEREMVALLEGLDPDAARRIGESARQRALREHTYEVRARQLLDLLQRL